MFFIWPAMLLSLLLVPLFIGLYLRMQQRRRRLVASYSTLGLMQTEARRMPGLRRHLPPLLFLIGLTLLFLALARPQTVLSLPRVEGTIILAFDVSGSMAAEDLQPTRMEAAKAAAREFVQHQPATVQIGIVAFSDGGFTVQMPTNDQEAIFSTINRLTPQRGTSVGQGILVSLNTIEGETGETVPPDGDPTPAPTPTPLPEGTYSPAVIVLLTDGENNQDPDPLAAAQVAADRGVRIYTIGLGSAEGITLDVDGFIVHTQLNEATLQQISQLTDGAYYNAQNEEELRAIYENLDPQLVVKSEKLEVTSVFAGASMLALMIGGAFSLLWFGHLP